MSTNLSYQVDLGSLTTEFTITEHRKRIWPHTFKPTDNLDFPINLKSLFLVWKKARDLEICHEGTGRKWKTQQMNSVGFLKVRRLPLEPYLFIFSTFYYFYYFYHLSATGNYWVLKAFWNPVEKPSIYERVDLAPVWGFQVINSCLFLSPL